MIVYGRELRRNAKGLAIWSAVMCGYILLLLSMYPQFAADQEAMQQMLEAYPDSLKQAFGMDALNYGDVLGYYGVQIYMFITLIGSIYAAMLAGGILVKEENEKTVEFLLSKPISRAEVVLQKLAAAFTNLLVFNALMAAASLAGFRLSNDDAAMNVYVLFATGAFLLHAAFASIAFLLSAVLRKSRSIVSASLGLVFFSYALHIAAGVSEPLRPLAELSLFHYVDAADIATNESIEAAYVAAMLALSALCLLGAFLYYKRKDITV
ncbi:ABC transporter permease subunit [Paenibacillus sp.]|uniref:ABC transporter permease subunit n=1 Tax=Paenibacillus sp. TaxID=58172 RepID=UPI002D38323B|nr:ABC transporter permease subunit [Paenibacillus sp.]HZG55414.1 ABC transporter permease subunit [Paenibacillus sp.]